MTSGISPPLQPSKYTYNCIHRQDLRRVAKIIGHSRKRRLGHHSEALSGRRLSH